MFEVYASTVLGQEYGTVYDHRIEVVDDKSLAEATSHDYVCAEYLNNRRNRDNFVKSNCLGLDVDNANSDDPKKWVTAENLIADFPDVTLGIHFSRNNMKDKVYQDKKTGEVLKIVKARPRFHVLFEIDPVTSEKEYGDLKRKVIEQFSYFDPMAADSARFFFGTKDAQVRFVKGSMTLNEYMFPADFEAELATIKVGTRNTTLSRIAGKILKRFGDTDEAYDKFLSINEKCEVPLEDSELGKIWNSALKFFKKVSSDPNYIPPEKYGVPDLNWARPVPIQSEQLPDFPVDALPPVLANYVKAVATSAQTSVDMPAVAALAVASACMRNCYKVKGKSDWSEPTNIFCVVVAESSERKSAVTTHITRPVDEYVLEYNNKHKSEFALSRSQKRKLENKHERLISASRKKGESDAAEDFNDELKDVVQRLCDFQEVKPLKIYVDDITPEKLTEVLAENDNAIALISSEGGIFDVLSGAYSNRVNIDVFLKGYSGENIFVERINRTSLSVIGACLTIYLSVQPVVISDFMANPRFKHRGLTARFLYSIPKSMSGTRDVDSASIPNDAYNAYRDLIRNILMEEKTTPPKDITISPEAWKEFADFYKWVEHLIGGEYTMYASWLGKLAGNTLRIAGILARCSVMKKDVGGAVLESDLPITIEAQIMQNAIEIGRYFFAHAVAAYGVMGVNTDYKAVLKVIETLKKRDLHMISRRDLMRHCRWIGTAKEAQKIIDDLEDYYFIQVCSVDPLDKMNNLRPKNAVYAVNPAIFK